MVYKNRKQIISEDLLPFIEKTPIVTKAAYNRLFGEIGVKYGSSDRLTKEILDNYIATGRLRIEG